MAAAHEEEYRQLKQHIKEAKELLEAARKEAEENAGWVAAAESARAAVERALAVAEAGRIAAEAKVLALMRQPERQGSGEARAVPGVGDAAVWRPHRASHVAGNQRFVFLLAALPAGGSAAGSGAASMDTGSK